MKTRDYDFLPDDFGPAKTADMFEFKVEKRIFWPNGTESRIREIVIQFLFVSEARNRAGERTDEQAGAAHPEAL